MAATAAGGAGGATAITFPEVDALFAWAKGQGAFVSGAVAPGLRPDGVRGMFATRAVAKGTVLFQPVDAHLGEKAIANHPTSAQLQGVGGGLRAQLAALLTVERRAALPGGGSGKYGPVVRMMPPLEEAHNHYLLSAAVKAEASVLARLDAVSPVGGKVLRNTLRATGEFRKELAACLDAIAPGVQPPNLEEAAWAWSVVASRMWSDGLWPGADLFNHADDALPVNHGVVVAARDLKAGDEVFVSYGTKPALQMLLSYGFYDIQRAAPCIPANISIRTSDAVPFSHTHAALLRNLEAKTGPGQSLILASGPAPVAMAYARLATLEASEMTPTIDAGSMISAANEGRACGLLDQCIAGVLKDNPDVGRDLFADAAHDRPVGGETPEQAKLARTWAHRFVEANWHTRLICLAARESLQQHWLQLVWPDFGKGAAPEPATEAKTDT